MIARGLRGEEQQVPETAIVAFQPPWAEQSLFIRVLLSTRLSAAFVPLHDPLPLCYQTKTSNAESLAGLMHVFVVE
jgi:hypothetical protein